MRVTIYIRDRRDSDIVDYLDSADFLEGDQSLFIRELIRDGIKFRTKGNDYSEVNLQRPTRQVREEVVYGGDVPEVSLPQPESTMDYTSRDTVQNSNEGVDFSDIELTKKEVSREELESKFNKL